MKTALKYRTVIPEKDETLALVKEAQGFLDGKYSREMFWVLAKFKKPTHQISFHTEAALKTFEFIGGENVYEK